MNVGSLFSGIGGFDLGFERAGMRTAWQCEADPFCRRVLAHHWPGVPCYPDVTELRGAEVEPVDLLCGGFPCQDISLAGKGAGIDGARSGLWAEFARLIGELRPRYVVVENVPALLGRGAGRVLGDLAALRYDAEWDCLPASAFGAPHQRDRFWLVAYPTGGRGISDGLEPKGVGRDQHARGDGTGGLVAHPEGNGCRSRGSRGPASGRAGESEPIRALQDADPDDAGRGILAEHDRRPELVGRRPPGRHLDGLRDEMADASSLGRQRPGQARNGRNGSANGGPRSEPAGTWPASQWEVEPALGRVADGFPGRVDQLRALGNALVPQIAEWIGRRLMELEPVPTPASPPYTGEAS